MIRPPPRSTLFPPPTLSRSGELAHRTRRHRRADHPQDLTRHPLGRLEDDVAGEAISHEYVRRPTPDVASLDVADERSEEHTSELQSRQYLVCRLLLEKKKKI